jgi:nucleoside-diphosphate-sugar epimerase
MLSKIVKDDLKFIVNHPLDWNLLKNSTALISGANGFLPSYLVETLLFLNDSKNLNIKVIALVRNHEKAQARFSHHFKRSDLELLIHDVTLPLAISSSVKIDYIIHAASQASPLYYSVDPIGTQNANTYGTSNLLQIAKEKNVKSFLFFSSGEVYGVLQPHQVPTKENDYGYLDPLLLRSCYGESKRMGENICVCWHHQYKTPVKIVRPFHTFGPGMDLEDGRVFADFVADIVHNRDIVMKSAGTDVRAFCYLADATLGFLKVLLYGKDGEAYNVGSDKETSIRELAEILVGLFPEKKLKLMINESQVSSNYVRSSIRRSCPDIAKMRALGWNPYYSVAEGFKRTIQSYLKESNA